MRSGFQHPKSLSHGVNLCEGCLQKPCEIDRLKAEVQRLKAQLSRQKRQEQKGYLGSSTPSSQVPLKANARQENHRHQGGIKPGHWHDTNTFPKRSLSFAKLRSRPPVQIVNANDRERVKDPCQKFKEVLDKVAGQAVGDLSEEVLKSNSS